MILSISHSPAENMNSRTDIIYAFLCWKAVENISSLTSSILFYIIAPDVAKCLGLYVSLMGAKMLTVCFCRLWCIGSYFLHQWFSYFSLWASLSERRFARAWWNYSLVIKPNLSDCSWYSWQFLCSVLWYCCLKHTTVIIRIWRPAFPKRPAWELNVSPQPARPRCRVLPATVPRLQ